MSEESAPLVASLLDPQSTLRLPLRAWNGVLSAARYHGLLARLGEAIDAAGLWSDVPPKARRQMWSARIAAESTHTAVRFEINRVVRALGSLAVPVVLLKGSAYVVAGLPCAAGRLVGDLDLMVPRDRIEAVEQALVDAGWLAAELDEYDQRYYREWAHEIPPLEHPERDTPLDIHHTIVPLTSRLRPNAQELFARSLAVSGPMLRVLGPADMVLHSTVHLFNDEVGKPLRDLLDLNDLLRHFGQRPEFWDELVDRARVHGLGRPLYYMLSETQRVLGTAIPPRVRSELGACAPNAVVARVMDRLFAYRFAADPPDVRRRGAGLAEGVLYIRSHWLRMPPRLLVRHLSHKSLKRLRERFQPQPEHAET